MTVESCYLDWRPATNSVQQGSVLGPLMFLIDINDLDDNAVNMGGKFQN